MGGAFLFAQKRTQPKNSCCSGIAALFQKERTAANGTRPGAAGHQNNFIDIMAVFCQELFDFLSNIMHRGIKKMIVLDNFMRIDKRFIQKADLKLRRFQFA